MIVKDILTAKGREVATISPTATLADAAKTLAERRIGALVVTGAGKRVIGIVSERDIVRILAARGKAALGLSLTEVMTRKVVSCVETDTVSAIMEHMTSGKFRHIPVLDGERLAGIISIGDVVKLRLHEMETEQSALRDYIQTA
ncbi:MAG: CBS domain-containing protein [Pseudorhodoplanes sp.]|nr:Inosine-5'-monophosphate dehydrogenase [Pseudorhodoplanes sp.]MCQ3941754.1 inosine-5-monophosphate dehydrogenase [Alphaproteobacteria bacterium]MBW7948402.1 CBS domain-containing protein [Pseudorhodoplanes sp.]MCL4711344.1 CBS domain-containing protein [Pseudorhodoplanes sp.]MCZ7642594.1 CBS domain-containing protein [Pseudorhodoplanes sp.]